METFFLIFLSIAVATLAVLLRRKNQMLIDEKSSHLAAIGTQRIRLQKEQDRLLNALNDAFLIVDSGGVILFANRPARTLVTGRVLKGRKVKEVFLDNRMTAAIEESMRTGENSIQQANVQQSTGPKGAPERRGETAWLIDAAPLDDDPATRITRVVIRDITTEHQTEQVRKDFVANASHELRTPLSIINGYLENLVDGEVEDSAFLRRSLVIMQKHGDRIARIVEDMLVISRLESGEMAALNKEPFSLRECVQDVLDRLESVISGQQAVTSLDFAEEDFEILGDRFYWTQVFFNLIENALKQNPRLPIRVEVGAKKSSRETLNIWVKDNGIGIPSADLPFIFRRFYRVEKHHNQNSIKGTGLGLSIVKRAVEAHDGEITVRSTPGQETVFEISL